MCPCVAYAHEFWYHEKARGHLIPGAGVTGNCKPPDMGSGNQTSVKSSAPPSHLSCPCIYVCLYSGLSICVPHSCRHHRGQWPEEGMESSGAELRPVRSWVLGPKPCFSELSLQLWDTVLALCLPGENGETEARGSSRESLGSQAHTITY